MPHLFVGNLDKIYSFVSAKEYISLSVSGVCIRGGKF